MSGSNPLLHPPFFLIPGIDPSAPVSAQTEQVDQLNTLLLQEIDANFAKFHQIITAKVLPEIKRFALASEPTREAANFWRTFFEAASAVRLPTSELSMTMDQSQLQAADASYDNDQDHTLTLRRNPNDPARQDLTLDSDEQSSFFAPAASSTPLPPRHYGDHRPSAGGLMSAPGFAAYDASFADSLESPFDKLDRRLQDDLQLSRYDDEGESSGLSSLPPHLAMGYDTRPGHISVGAMGMDVGGGSMRSPSSDASGANTPRAPQQAPRHQREQSIQSVQSAQSGREEQWTGLTDLRTTPLNAKFKLKPGVKVPKSKQAGPNLASGGGASRPGAAGQRSAHQQALDDLTREFDLQMDDLDRQGSSPGPPRSPRMSMGTTFSMPPRAAAIHNAARTPVRGSAASSSYGGGGRAGDSQGGEIPADLILADLMEEIEMDGFASPGPMRTPEGLRRYSIMPSDLSHSSQHAGGSSSSGLSGNIFNPGSRSNQTLEEEDEGQELEDDDTFHGSALAQQQQQALGSHSHQQSFDGGAYQAMMGSQRQVQQPSTRRSLAADTSFGSEEDDQEVAPASRDFYSNDNADEGDSLDDLSRDSFDDDLDDDENGQDGSGVPGSAYSHAGSVLSHHSHLSQQQGGIPGSGSGSYAGASGSHDIIDDDSFMSDASFAFDQPGSYAPNQAGGHADLSTERYGGGSGSGLRDPTDTVFGAAPLGGQARHGQPHAASRYAPMGAGAGAAGQGQGQFALMKMDEMDTYFGGKLEEADMGFSPLGERLIRKDHQ